MTADEIAKFEQLAEDAYTKMYDAPRNRARECYEDAMKYLADAIKAAEQSHLVEATERLKARKQHIYDVYTHQFR
ncbi:MAG TPA: hypothetical protein VMD53_00765 [Rhizomicrobium sp.]|nr:hypothetical protein [Rhizomicrobium sp.]